MDLLEQIKRAFGEDNPARKNIALRLAYDEIERLRAAAVGASVRAENEELEDKGRKRLAGALIGASQLGLSETECDQLAGVLLGEISLPALLGMDGKLRPIASAAAGGPCWGRR